MLTVVLLAFALVLVSCGKPDTQPKTEEENTEEVVTKSPPVPICGTRAKADSLKKSPPVPICGTKKK